MGIVCITQQCGVFAYRLYLLVHPSSLMALQSKRALLWRFNAASKYETYLGLRVACPLFLPEFNQIWNFSTDLNKSFEQQISRTGGYVKSLQALLVNVRTRVRICGRKWPFREIRLSDLFQQKRNWLFSYIAHFVVRGGVVNQWGWVVICFSG